MKLTRFAKNLLDGKWVEIMRAGTWNRTTFTTDDLHSIAESYDTNFRIAPLVIGHPSMLEVEGERDAQGVIAELRVLGDSLQARIDNLSDTVRNGLQSGKWINRSIEAMKFGKGEDRKWYLTGLALLGGSQPAVDAMLSDDGDKLCIDYQESESTESENNQPPLSTKGASQMDAAELKRLEALELQAGEFKTLQSNIKTLTDSVTELSKKVEGLTNLKTDYDALSASTAALVDAQAQLAVDKATAGIPKALCPDEKKAFLLSLHKSDRKAFDVEVGIFASMRGKFDYLTTELVKEDDGKPVVTAPVKDRSRFSNESLEVADRAAQLQAENPKLEYADAVIQASKEVGR